MSPAAASPPSFADWMDQVRGRVETRLEGWLATRVRSAADVGAEAGVVARALSELTLRGGKRLRASLVAAGFEAFAEDGADSSAYEPAMVAVELLQAYLLIHDDWMDGDETRRGGAAVHVLLRERLGTNLASAGAILAGDLGSALAQQALLECEVAPERLMRACRLFARTQIDVVMGQVSELEIEGVPSTRPPVELIHALKTASYTVTGPVALGAALAGADDAACAALARFGRPLGVAFQLRDDLLGAFGDPRSTGKPAFGDLRRHKRTAVAVAAGRDPCLRALLVGIGEGTPDDAIADVVRRLEEAGVRAEVEARIGELRREAEAALDDLPVRAVGRDRLRAACAALVERAS